jgi:predicted regulator of Ras-like GTPase activity (Roadblock/LC7/MglB family)
MSQVLAELKSISGLMGAVLLDPRRGVIASNVPPLFKADKIEAAARTLGKMFGAGRIGFPSTRDLVLHYSEMVLVVREIKQEIYLIAMCEPTINMGFLSMSLGLAAEDLAAAAAAPAAPTAAPVPAAPAAPAPSAPLAKAASMSVEEIRATDGLATPLSAMEAALNKIMGPMSKIIMRDSLRTWAEQVQPRRETLGKLLDILCREIGDEGKAQEYRALVGRR